MTLWNTLENSSPDDLILFCFEDAAGFYKPLIDLVEKHKSHLKKLIMIVISGDITQSANKYVFGAVPLLQISLTEKVNSVLANSMYEKLNEKTQLGKLVNYADRRKDIINYIKQINDFIDVLYVAHHMVPSRDTWLAMNACLDKYVNNANRVDRLLGDLFSNMCKFAKTNGLEIEHEQDVRRRLNQKVYDSTYVATEWSIDELPLYE